MNRNVDIKINERATFERHELADKQLRYTLDRTQQMFRWEGLPDTIPQRELELYLQTNGECFITEHEGNLYAYLGGQGGEPDEYYRPTLYTVSNPAQNLSHSFKIGEDGVLVRNDTLELGLIPLISEYGVLRAHSLITLKVALINARIPSIASATTDTELESAKKYFKDIADGKLGVVTDSTFTDGLRTSPYAASANRSIQDALECDQYIRATLFNELGLSSQTNMKRANMTEREVALGDDSLIPLLDDMLESRKKAADAINKMFGTNITVSLNSVWEHNKNEELSCNVEDIKEAGLDDTIEQEPTGEYEQLELPLEQENSTEQVQDDTTEQEPPVDVDVTIYTMERDREKESEVKDDEPQED